QGRRVGQAQVQRLGEIGVEHVLRVLEAAGMEAARAVHAQGVVDGVAGVEVEVVVAVAVAQVPGPAIVAAALVAQHRAPVFRVLVDLRHVAFRIDLGQQVALAAVVARAVEGERGDVAVAGDGGQVDLRALADVERGIGRDRELVDLGFAEAEPALAHAGEVAGVRRGALVGAGAVGRVLVPDLGGQVYGAAVAAQAQAGIAGQLPLGAVALGVLAAGGDQAAAFAGALEHDVDYAGDRVRAVLGRGPVTQHLHPLDRRHRDGVEVHRRGATADGAVDVDHGRDV